MNISYGLFLADHNILDILETELVVLPSIYCQKLDGPTSWHVRACKNVGIGQDDIAHILEVTKMIAESGWLKLTSPERVLAL